jgi:hypothetical protein
MTTAWAHHYISSACMHALGEERPGLHAGCRLSCKYAEDGVESCECPCHAEDATTLKLPPPWVDQARDVVVRLLAITMRCGVDLRHEDPDLFETIRDAPEMFWARGEVQPAGIWRPNTNDEKES